MGSAADPHGVDADPDPDPPFHFDADPDPTFHFDADPDPAFLFDADRDTTFHFDADPAFHRAFGMFGFLFLCSVGTVCSSTVNSHVFIHE